MRGLKRMELERPMSVASENTNKNNTSREVAIFDLDGTLTHKDTYLAFLIHVLKVKPLRLLRCWALPSVVVVYKLGLKKNDWLKERFLTAIAGGLPEETLGKLVESFLTHLEGKGMRQDGIKVLEAYQTREDVVVLATASFDFYVKPLAERLGISHVVCSCSARNNNGSLSGKLAGGNCYGDEKLKRVKSYFEEAGIEGLSIMYSDHHTDIPVLDWADQAVMVNPTLKLKEAGKAKGFKLAEWQ